MDRDLRNAIIAFFIANIMLIGAWFFLPHEKPNAPIVNTTEIKIDSLSQKLVGPGKLKKVDSNDHMTVYEYTKDGESYIVFSSEYEFLSVVKK
jgi:hypothetical protein